MKPNPTPISQPTPTTQPRSAQPEPPDPNDRKVEQEIRKLMLEVRELERKNSRMGTLAQVLPLVTMIVTIAGAVFGIQKFFDDAAMTRQQRSDEARQRLEVLYRSDLEQLQRFPVDDKMTIPLAIQLMEDLKLLIKEMPGLSDSERTAHRTSVSALLAELMVSSDFKLSEPRNVDLARRALHYWSDLNDYLMRNRMYNLNILSNYARELSDLHTKHPKLLEEAYFNASGVLYGPTGEDDELLPRVANLYLGYAAHVALLRDRLKAMPDTASRQATYDDLHQSFCWFSTATGNQSLTKRLFSLNDTTLAIRKSECER